MKITVDFTKTVRSVKAMHGVGQPPLLGKSCKYFHYLTEAGIPYSRLHDVGGAYGGYVFVDIPNLFRDFSPPASYCPYYAVFLPFMSISAKSLPARQMFSQVKRRLRH